MLYALSALLGGVCVAVQLVMNGQTRTALGGPLWAALANNAVGLVGLSLTLLLMGARLPGAESLRSVPALHWCAGLLGAAFITMNAFVAPKLGLAVTFLLVLAGQLVTALLIDHFGWFTGTPKPANSSVLLGIGLVFIGALLVVRAR
jgi:bacterial/archaeal transporter family-2 protein